MLTRAAKVSWQRTKLVCALIPCLPERWEYTESATSRHLSRQSDDRKDQTLKVNKRTVQQRKFSAIWRKSTPSLSLLGNFQGYGPEAFGHYRGNSDEAVVGWFWCDSGCGCGCCKADPSKCSDLK